MNIHASVYIATSLDGFIARPNGDLDWLTNGHDAPEGEDYGYQAFMDTVDGIIMGRHTFEKVLTFDAWPYPTHTVVVLSSRTMTLPSHLGKNVQLLSATPQDVMRQLATQGVHHVYVDGGTTIQRFLEAELINELIITRLPMLIGEGIPLFGAVRSDIKLTHVETRQFPNGFVQSRYRMPVRVNKATA